MTCCYILLLASSTLTRDLFINSSTAHFLLPIPTIRREVYSKGLMIEDSDSASKKPPPNTYLTLNQSHTLQTMAAAAEMLTSPFTARDAVIAAATASSNSNGRSSALQEQHEKKGGFGKHNDDADHCNCPNRCRTIEHLPPGHGLMIMLSENNNTAAACTGTAQNGNEQSKSSSSNSCTCLKLQSQHDTNLTSIHPNIYIPTPLLSHPTHLRKYGGGGSGVTVFGGYHPQLGPLVMKHGGYKDLIELVSLAKISREVRVRGRWKIDCLMKRRKGILLRSMDGQKDEEVGRGDEEGCGSSEEEGQWRGGLQTDHPGSIDATIITSEEMDNTTMMMSRGGGLTSVHSNIDTAASNNASTMLKSKSTTLFDKMKSFFIPPSSSQNHTQQLQQQEEETAAEKEE